MPSWTEQQKNAINARNSNILVSAAAGSGKTAVLVERVIKIITDASVPVNIDQLLIVTFTNAAASEMKSRISSRLENILKMNPSDKNALKQLSLLPGAKICTIDSFCITLLRENFFKLGISSDFSVMDESEENIIFEAALNDVLDSFYEKGDADFLSLTELLSSPKDDSALFSAIRRLYSYIYAQPFPLEWLRQTAEMYNPDVPLEKSKWYPCLLSEIKDGLESGIQLIDRCGELLDPSDELFEGYSANLASDRLVFEQLLKSLENGWDNIISAFGSVSFSRLASKRGYESPVKAQLSSTRDIYKNIVNKDLKELFCALSDDYKQDSEILYPIMLSLCVLLEALDKEIFFRKTERNSYSFSDIEHFAVRLLTEYDTGEKTQKSDIALDLEKSFYEILVDEYQDTNDTQELIYSMLSNGRNCFAVGDVKQSIYRFRLAMPQIFISKKIRYEDYTDSSACGNYRIFLDKNFRSRKDICDYVNYVFSSFMSEKTGDINYDENEYLNYGADYKDFGTVSAQLKILDSTASADSDKNEASCIANVILSKINSGELVKDGDLYRPVDFGDFAILLRSTKKHINQYRETLSSFGIPVVCDNTSNLFDCNEIKILLSLLRVIDNPMQDIALLAVMMSPLYGFSADEMAEIKISSKGKSLYSCVVKSHSDKVKRFLEEIDMFSKTAVTMSVSSFIRFLCEFKSIYAFANALGNGEQRCRNIGKFIEFAAAFDASGSIGLTSFMRYADKVAESDRGIESASLTSTAENAVTIMSVHHSKGLEFPIVILAGAARKYNTRDLSEKLLLNPEFGVGLKVHNEEKLYDYSTIHYTVIKRLNKRALLSENLRVLYVAMTRAKEQFISFVTLESLETRLKSLAPKISSGSISPYLCMNMGSDADFILMSALIHQNGTELRKRADIDIKTVFASFNMDVEIIDALEDIEEPKMSEKAEPSNEIVSAIRERLSYKYENTALSSVSAKRTASSLDKSVSNMEYFTSSKPAFMSSGEMTPGEKGTAMHTFMQFCDYDNARNNLENEITRLTERSFITSQQADSLNRNALAEFFNGEFGKRIFKSDKLYRELKISSFVKVRELEDIDSDEEVLIQGISDCVFEEDGELVLVDYKTDRIKSEEQLLDMYRNQIAFYKSAVSKALRKNVKQAYLYSFKLGKACLYK